MLVLAGNRVSADSAGYVTEEKLDNVLKEIHNLKVGYNLEWHLQIYNYVTFRFSPITPINSLFN